MTEASYRNVFLQDASATRYDEVVYAHESSADILWQVERRILRELAVAALHGKRAPAYLDFACGTGRIIAALEDLATQPVGIDVSESMLNRARQRCVRARLLCADITRAGAEIEGRYDLITSFRFLTNAEPELRAAVLRALHRRLKNHGTLLVNTHGNPLSYRLLSLPYHWLKDNLAGRSLYGYLSNGEARQLLAEAGFRIERIVGMGFVPAKLLPFVGPQAAAWIEEHLAATPAIQWFGLNQLFVCRKA